MTTTKPDIIYKPKYNGSMRFAMLLYPVWAALTAYFIYQWILTRSFSPQGFLAIVFGIMTISLPFRVIREVRFGDRITVRRYLLTDMVIEYKDIIAFDKLRLDARNKGISLLMFSHESLEEFEKIIHNLINARKIKLKKR